MGQMRRHVVRRQNAIAVQKQEICGAGGRRSFIAAAGRLKSAPRMRDEFYGEFHPPPERLDKLQRVVGRAIIGHHELNFAFHVALRGDRLQDQRQAARPLVGDYR